MLLLTVLVGLLLNCVVNLPATLGWAYRQWEVGRQYDQCKFDGFQFSLRITAFHERGAVFAAPGSYHRYEVDYVKTKPLSNQDFETSDYGLTWYELQPKEQ